MELCSIPLELFFPLTCMFLKYHLCASPAHYLPFQDGGQAVVMVTFIFFLFLSELIQCTITSFNILQSFVKTGTETLVLLSFKQKSLILPDFFFKGDPRHCKRFHSGQQLMVSTTLFVKPPLLKIHVNKALTEDQLMFKTNLPWLWGWTFLRGRGHC